jgi:hypothetical protein
MLVLVVQLLPADVNCQGLLLTTFYGLLRLLKLLLLRKLLQLLLLLLLSFQLFEAC